MSKVNKMNPKVGVVILTYNATEFITDCIFSVLKNTYRNFEIVIVDNHSADNTREKIRKKFNNIKIIKNSQNLGYAGGNNVGIKYFLQKKAEYILLLNPDTIIDKKTIEILVNQMQGNVKIGTIGPIITYMHDNQKIWFAGGHFNQTFCYTRHPYIGENVSETKVKSRSVDFITGACIMLRSKMLQQTGLLPERYFLYFEDAFFCQKVKEYGYRNYLVAKPLVQHIVSASTGETGKTGLSSIQAYYYGRNPLLYIRKEIKGTKKIINIIGQFAIRLPHYTFQLIKEKRFKIIAVYIRGIYDGLRK